MFYEVVYKFFFFLPLLLSKSININILIYYSGINMVYMDTLNLISISQKRFTEALKKTNYVEHYMPVSSFAKYSKSSMEIGRQPVIPKLYSLSILLSAKNELQIA
ncbi:MAG: hypothetical protein ACXQS3_02070 [Candidatus Methanofastidiosia archaeon]